MNMPDPILEFKQNMVVLALGAHADDVPLGCAASLYLLKKYYNARILYRVFCRYITEGQKIDREKEMKSSAKMLGLQFNTESSLYEDKRLPSFWFNIQKEIGRLRDKYKPELIFAPSLHDPHQDHATVAEGVIREFRHGAPIWHYEIKPYNLEHFHPNIFINVSLASNYEDQEYMSFCRKLSGEDTIAHLKVFTMQKCLRSQLDRPDFNPELLLGIMRLRAGQSMHNLQYAEAFEGRVVIR